MATRVFVSAASARRLDEASSWLARHRPDDELWVVSATLEAARALVARTTAVGGATFGWQPTTLARLASNIAGPELAARGIVTAGHLVLEALCARLVHDRGNEGVLGRFQPLAGRPGLVRALARTVQELRLAGLSESQLEDSDLAPIVAAYERALGAANLADRAQVLRTAAEVLRREPPTSLSRHLPTLLLDVAISSALEGELVAALVSGSDDVLAVVPAGDVRTVSNLERALGASSGTRVDHDLDDPTADARGPATSLARLQRRLFDPSDAPHSPLDDGIVVLSAPGESRECVEIARRIHREAERGTSFDRMAVLLRAPTQYRAHLEEAFRRAGIPAHFAQGTSRPDPSGRAFLALLACVSEGLSARRFAEYLSLGQVPERVPTGAPPEPVVSAERWVPSDDDLVPNAIARARGAEGPGDDATLPAPRRWERLLVEASVIGGRERWTRRLEGLRRELELDLAAVDDPDAPRALSIARSLSDLAALRAYALPLLECLDALPEGPATWAVWLEQLSALASRSLRNPQRVLSVLAELAPMGPIGPVYLHEVRLVLAPRLRDLLVAPETTAEGRVFVGPTELARGMSFDVVFVPGLAEKVFPQKVVEDPVLADAARTRLDARGRLDTNHDRIANERLALRLAVGAARRRVIVSWARLDVEQARPRVPSFYGLEVLRAAEGMLSGFDELARRAEHEGLHGEGGAATRLGWPAPASPMHAIDDAEHDLSVLASLLRRPDHETKGTAHYLLQSNPHLARALRARARRWIRRWTSADGLVELDPTAKPALALHALHHRSYSPTALQHFAACPYRFVLQAIHRLAPREAPEAIEELDPLQRGSLVHEVLYELHVKLREQGKLPLRELDREHVRALLDETVDSVAARFRDELAPAIDRVWDDGIAAIRADVREWLSRALDPSSTGGGTSASWTPWKFELSFGLPQRRAEDPASTDQPVTIAGGLKLRGSIDVVEQSAHGTLRATDYKTGKARTSPDAVIGGGETLQPVFYALTLEQLFPGMKIESGRLYFCTHAGEYKEVVIPLDDFARRAAAEVVSTVAEAIDTGFLPAAPAQGACEWCDYRPVCGPHEEQRLKVKAKDRLVRLRTLREMP